VFVSSVLRLTEAPGEMLLRAVTKDHIDRAFIDSIKLALTEPLPSAISEEVDHLLGELHDSVSTDVAEATREVDQITKDQQQATDRIAYLTRVLQYDFGPNSTMAHFLTLELSLTLGEYIYRVAPFSQMKQANLGKDSSVLLGSFNSWVLVMPETIIPEEVVEEEYPRPKMKFAYGGGVACFFGTVRSAELWLRCGGRDEILRVVESSKCRYVVLGSSPVACVEGGAEEMAWLQASMLAGGKATASWSWANALLPWRWFRK